MLFKRADFPKDFLFGSTVLGGQHEGSTLGDVLPGANGNQACGHGGFNPRELDLVREAGFDCYRFSVKWAHVMPNGRGVVSQKGLDYYDSLADALLERELRPCATLYDNTLPEALADLGGWRNRDCAGWFSDFTEIVMSNIGDRIYSVAPIEMPSSFSMLGEAQTSGLNENRAKARMMHHLLVAHGKAIAAMRGLGMTNLGAVFSLDLTSSAASSPDIAVELDDILSQCFLGGVFNNAYPDVLLEILEPILPTAWRDDFEAIGTPIDWCGLRFNSLKPIDPNALTSIQQAYTKELPIYLMENGENGSEPPHDDKGLNQNLKVVQKTLELGTPVKGYFIRTSGKDNLPALETMLAGSSVSLPLAQPAGAMHEHWNLVADIGGTNTRLGVISNGKLTDLRKYPTGTLPELLEAFHSLRDEIGTDPRAVVAAGAGPVKDGTIRLTNANLDLSEHDIGKATGAQHTFVINDFTAAAWSVAEITGDDVEVLQGAATPPRGTRLVVGPGTGLGVGALLYSEGRYHTASGEGGHVGLSPRHVDEVEVFRAARHISPDCFFDDTLVLEAEMFLSGTGLPILYQAAGMAAGQANTPVRSARDILEDARAQTDPIAVKAAHMFTTHLGAVMGDLAVVLIPSGGVFLLGGVAEKNRWLFKDAFRDAFNAGGRFSDLRRSFNLYVSEQDEFGIVGANNFCKSALAR
ncbi:family 1 glycosylhydrolase [Ruegeria arenilitoris]|uniref:family 1 glycosylhydrolase n=1 Tax=Ruegeria arenilitoris TaxID=1173585 RepID=UPI00147B96CA|nr:family 1 glycosylhydrolase [Ruegeria arenilitoris]